MASSSTTQIISVMGLSLIKDFLYSTIFLYVQEVYTVAFRINVIISYLEGLFWTILEDNFSLNATNFFLSCFYRSKTIFLSILLSIIAQYALSVHTQFTKQLSNTTTTFRCFMMILFFDREKKISQPQLSHIIMFLHISIEILLLFLYPLLISLF